MTLRQITMETGAGARAGADSQACGVWAQARHVYVTGVMAATSARITFVRGSC